MSEHPDSSDDPFTRWEVLGGRDQRDPVELPARVTVAVALGVAGVAGWAIRRALKRP